MMSFEVYLDLMLDTVPRFQTWKFFVIFCPSLKTSSRGFIHDEIDGIFFEFNALCFLADVQSIDDYLPEHLSEKLQPEFP